MVWQRICPVLNNNTKISLYDSIDLVNGKDWNAANSKNNIYLSIAYLKALEQSLLHEIEFRYLQFYNNNNEIIGIAAVQIVSLKDSVDNYQDVLCRLKESIRKKLMKKIEANILICGNLFSCGENGFSFSDQMEEIDISRILHQGLKRVKASQKLSDNAISFLLLKEFWPKSYDKVATFKKMDYREFKIDDNMVLPLHSKWESFDDYLGSMTAKYRTRVNGVYKKSRDLEVRPFGIDDLEVFEDRIGELYLEVNAKADFSLGGLNASTFKLLKRNLKDKLLFNGYFLDNNLVGFSSCFVLNEEILDANFVGIDYDLNKAHAIYQRMLYDMVKCAIQNGYSEIRFGRTAEELKSCIGAVPTGMKLFIRHRNHLSNQLLKPIISTIHPREYELRYPFKSDFVLA